MLNLNTLKTGGDTMYDEILDSYFDVFDGETGDYIGHSHFSLPTGSERKLLDLINYNRVPDTLTLLNVTLSRPSGNYIPPELFQKHNRLAILHVDAVESYSGKLVPIEIRMGYDVVARGNLSGNQYYFESLELDNIELISIDITHV